MPVRDEQWEARQATIRQILAKRVIRTQVQLLDALRQRGFEVTQSSVSRDLADLKAAKLDGRYRTAEALEPTLPGSELREVSASILRVQPAGPNLLVVHTPPGRATLVAVALDLARWPQMAGCIAGDDTVFVATDGKGAQDVVKKRIERILEEAGHA